MYLKKLLFLILPILSWIVSLEVTYGQTSSGQDSSTCFTRQEREQIALQLIEGHECDTLLKVAEVQLFIADTINKNLEKKTGNLKKENSNLQEEIRLSMTIIQGQEKDLTHFQKENKKLRATKNWLTFGLGGVTLALGIGFIIYAVTHP